MKPMIPQLNIREAIKDAEHILKCVDISYPEDIVLKKHLDSLLSKLDDLSDQLQKEVNHA